MKKYNNFLLERNDTRIISEEDTIKILLTCKHVDLDNPLVGRSIYELKSDYYLIDPKKHDRKSANTRNYYTYIIDNSKDWEDFPKRSKSLICHGYAKRPPYYDQYVVIPLNDANFGIANDDDLWTSFEFVENITEVPSLKNFNTLLSKLYYLLIDEYLSDESAEIFFNNLEKLSLKIQEPESKNIIKNNDDSWSANIVQLFDFLLSESLKGNDCRTALELLFNPVQNDILHMSFTDMQKHLQTTGLPSSWGVEVWTDSECLLIKNNLYNDLIKKFKK
jgi:hypothetical protein